MTYGAESKYGAVIKPRVTAKPRSLHWVNQWAYYDKLFGAGAGNRSWAIDEYEYERAEYELHEYEEYEYESQYAALMKWGLLYVPEACDGGADCRLHINYHGCIARNWNMRWKWATSLDLNEYALCVERMWSLAR